MSTGGSCICTHQSTELMLDQQQALSSGCACYFSLWILRKCAYADWPRTESYVHVEKAACRIVNGDVQLSMTFSSSSPGYSLQGTADPQHRSEAIHADYNPAYDPSHVFEERLASICGSIEAVEMKCEASDERRRDAEKQLLVVTQRCLSPYCGFLTTTVHKLQCGLKRIRFECKPL